MPGFLYKHTLIFSGADHGWTESLYFEQTTDDVNGALGFVADVKNKRARLLGAQFSIKGERVALIRTDTGEKVTRRAVSQRRFVPGVAAQPGEDSGTSLLVKWTNSSASRSKLMFMGGPYAAVFPFADAFDPNAGNWGTNFTSWRSLMIQLGMGWLHRVPVLTGFISGYTVNNATGIVTYNLEPPGIVWPAANLFRPTAVSIEFPNSTSPLDGPQVVIPQGNLIATSAKPRPAGPWTVQGVLKTFGYEFVNIATLNAQGNPGTIKEQSPVSRKRGRPLLVSRGRQRARPRW